MVAEKGDPPKSNGRPKGSKNRATSIRHWLESEEIADNPITGVLERLTQEDIITLALISKARDGDVAAYKALMDSAYGAPKQGIEHAEADGEPVKLKVTLNLGDAPVPLLL